MIFFNTGCYGLTAGSKEKKNLKIVLMKTINKLFNLFKHLISQTLSQYRKRLLNTALLRYANY
jgi:hypothetical protein